MRGRFRREHALDPTLAEAVLVLGKSLGEVVAHERGGNRPAWGDAEPAPDDRRAQQGLPIARHFLPPLQDHARADAGGAPAKGEPLFHREQDFADTEQAYYRNQEIDSA